MKKAFNCSQDDLYTVTRMVIYSCIANIVDFARFRSIYTLAYLNGLLAQLAATAAMPDLRARSEAYEILRLQLLASAKNCRALWRQLKRHIEVTYPKDVAAIKLEAATANETAAERQRLLDKLAADRA